MERVSKLVLSVLAVGAFVFPGCAQAADESAESTPAAVAAAPDAEGWEETAGLQLLVDGVLDPGGHIYDSPDFQHTLIVPSKGTPFLLALRAQEVLALGAEDVAWTQEKRPVPDEGSAESVGLFMNDEGLISFDTELASFQVQPEPPLVGEISLAKLREAKPDYVLLADEFTPDAKTIEALKALPGGEAHVFFGTWCSYCKHWLPPFMKTMELLGDKFTVKFYGMSEDMSEPAGALSKYDVSATPSFVIMRDGKELGRIVEEPLDSMEADLLHILQK